MARGAALVAGMAVAGLAAACSGAASGVDRPTPSPTIPATGYSALGDSYSSGEGVGDFQAGTDVTDDRCHRSSLAYAPLLDSAKQLGKLTFLACAGAVTNDLLASNHEANTNPETHAIEPAQIGSIPVHARTVTLTIGGNDAGFAGVLSSCVLGKVGPINVFPHFVEAFNGCHGNARLAGTVATRLKALAGTAQAESPEGTPIVAIGDLLAGIHQRAPLARIYLVGYPVLFGSFSGSCHVGDVKVAHVPLVGDVRIRLSVSAADAAWLNGVADKLNGVLRDAATKAAGTGIPATFVDVSGHFTGHRLCDSSASWISPVAGHADLGSRSSSLDASSFHPTRDGQREGYEAALLDAGIN